MHLVSYSTRDATPDPIPSPSVPHLLQVPQSEKGGCRAAPGPAAAGLPVPSQSPQTQRFDDSLCDKTGVHFTAARNFDDISRSMSQRAWHQKRGSFCRKEESPERRQPGAASGPNCSFKPVPIATRRRRLKRAWCPQTA